MEGVFYSQPVILLMEAGAVLFAGLAVWLFVEAVNGFLERRRKVYELVGDTGFTFKRKVKEVMLSIRQTVEKINVKFTRNKRYARIEKMIRQMNLEDEYTRESFMLDEEAAFFAGFVVMYLLMDSISFALISAFVFAMMPYMSLKSRVEKKRYKILRTIPNALDIIAAYIEGGMSLPSAVVKYAKKSNNIFAKELKTAVKQMEIGRSFADVMQDMEERLETRDVTTVVNAFIQAEKSGGSIRRIIQSQADEIRKRHFLALKQKAHEAPVKLLIPMILFIFPVIFIILFGPIALKFMHGF